MKKAGYHRKKRGGVITSNKFYAKTEILQPYGLKQIVLSDHHHSIKILPERGSNLYSFIDDGVEFLMRPDDQTFQEGRFGIPILFPTPNRVRNGAFKFNGREYQLMKEGKPLLIHGFARDVSWKHKEPEAEESCARLVSYLEVDEGQPMYESFPFKYRVQLTHILERDGFSIEYEVENFDKRPLPFGFGLHPYFARSCDEDNVFIQVPAEYFMETIDLMPTGAIKEAQGTEYDLLKPKPLGTLDLNNTYWKLDSRLLSTILYPDLKRKLILQASDDFTHMVVFTPRDRPFFCLENQTCSADAHNLYEEGKKDISGLIVLKPREMHKGWVHFTHHYL